MECFQLMAAAPASGSGKTVTVCALLAALKKRGVDPCAFKCGPDYIDPMFHRAALGVPSCNLDLFLTAPARLRQLYAGHLAGHGAAVVEAAMGYYDGAGLTDAASAWQVADTLDLPVLLVVRPGGASLTLAAQIRGLRQFRTRSHLAAILLNGCSSSYAGRLAPVLERETGLPVVGCLPRLEAAQLPSRHLGLYTAGEIAGLDGRLEALAQALEANTDLDRLLELCRRPAPEIPTDPAVPRRAVVAVARDEAFCFCYPETLAALEQAGARCAFFSPLRDTALPAGASGLYLPGGYPELHAQELGRNTAMRQAIARAVEGGMPTVAECGGFLYLGQSLADEAGRSWPMVGVLPGQGRRAEGLVRFGYATLTARRDSLLFRQGEQVPVHEFHHWDSSACGDAFAAHKPDGRSWDCGFASASLYAAFPHLYFAGSPALAGRFAAAAAAYRKEPRYEAF